MVKSTWVISKLGWEEIVNCCPVLGKGPYPRGWWMGVTDSMVMLPEPQRKGFNMKLNWNALELTIWSWENVSLLFEMRAHFLPLLGELGQDRMTWIKYLYLKTSSNETQGVEDFYIMHLWCWYISHNEISTQKVPFLEQNAVLHLTWS